MYKTLFTLVFILSLIHSIYSQQDSSSPILEDQKEEKISNAHYEMNFAFQFGGEAKLTILPKFNILRKHKLPFLSPYYGLEAGIHPLMIAGAFSFSGIVGIEQKRFNLESSISHFRTTKISDGDEGFNGPYGQNLFNIKIGFRIGKVRLKLGRSFILREFIPTGQTRIPLLNLGEINGNIYGAEVQILLD